MALWLVNAGKYGEHEAKFIADSRVCLTWDGLDADMSKVTDVEEVKRIVQETYSEFKINTVRNWAGQIATFVLKIQLKDWVVMPRRSSRTIAIGEVVSGYKFDASQGTYHHYRDVKWLSTEIPRSSFDQDLLYSFGAFLTICSISRNDAESRVRSMARNSWLTLPTSTTKVHLGEAYEQIDADESNSVDLEQLARDSIAKLIIQKFKGHGLARLVDAILKAKGFTTHLSPEGPDQGIDILAGTGAFGFDSPRICVQVKSGDTPAAHPEFIQLSGAMASVHAEQGLFVSWAGFKPTVLKEVPTKFFKIRLWSQNDLIEQLLENYENLDQDIRVELPLKRIWTISPADI